MSYLSGLLVAIKSIFNTARCIQRTMLYATLLFSFTFVQAQDETLTFSGADQAALTTYTEGSYTITATGGNFSIVNNELVRNQHPTISIKLTSGGDFTFASMDFIGLASDETTLFVQAKKNGSNVGTALSTLSSTTTLSGTSDFIGIDEVVITANSTDFTEMDNINLDAASSNTAPSFTSSAVTSVLDNQIYNYTPTATDADNDALTFTAPTLPSWLTFQSNPNVVTTFAGSGSSGTADGTGTSATFNGPAGLALDNSGNIYIADAQNHLIRKMTPAGVVTTVAGTGATGSADGTGTSAAFNFPIDLDIDDAGNLYVVEFLGHRIRKIDPSGVVTTIAGSGNAGTAVGTGTSAEFNQPAGIVLDASGNLFVTDAINSVIKKITPAGVVTTFAGNYEGHSDDGSGSTAGFSVPKGIAIDAAGNFYVSEEQGHKIRKVTSSGVISTIAGSGTGGTADGSGTAAQFRNPWGISVDSDGNIFVSDLDHHLIRKVTSDGVVSTIAGNGSAGNTDGTGTSSDFNLPIGNTLDGQGNLYIGNYIGQTVRKIALASTKLTGSSTGQAGDHNVTLKVDDGNGGTAEQSFVVAVTAANSAPAFTSTAVTSVLDNQTYTYSPTATDADNDALTFSATTKPSWLTLRTPDNFKVSTIAGNGSRPSPPINGTGTVATFLEPEALVTDSNGNIYVADTHHQLVRKITPQGVVSTLAGQYGAGGLSGVDGTGTNATFVGLSTLTITNTDIIYVADKSIIRKVTTGGVVTTFAGNNDAGNTATDFPTDGTGTAANFHEIDAMVVDANGNLFVGDKNNINTSGIIRKVTPAGVVTTLAGGQTGGTTGGTGTAAQFTMPRGMDFDSQGVLHFADASIIYKMDGNNVVTPIAGSTGGAQDIDGTGTSARFNFIRGIALDSKDDIYVVAGPSQRVRKVTQQGVVTTPIGLVLGFLDGYDNDAKFNQPFGIHIDDNDVFYISDRENGAIRKIEKSAVLLTGDPASQIGNHNVTLKVDDGNGGTAEQTFVVAVTTPLAVSISAQSDISCNGGSDGSATAVGAGGTSPYTYFWNDGSTTATVNTFSAGTYTVTVTDNAAATSTTTVTLTEPDALVVSTSADSNVSCNGGSDGSATAVGSGGTAPYTYFWNNGATTASITGQTAGTYTVSITDANGCNPAVDQITITEPAVLDVSVTGQTNVSAFGGADGSATAQASGGTAPYTYSWNNGQVGATANGLFASTYTVSVTDANGCNPATTSVTITQPANSLPVFTSTPVTSILDNQIYNYPLTASDANDEFFTFTLTSPTAPSWLSIVTEYEGEVTTFAGSGFGSQQDGTGTSATFASPKSVATDATGNIYIAESGIGGTPLIRKVSPDGVVTTIAGGASGYVDGTGTNAGFIRPFGIAVDVSGNIFVSDLGSTNANTIRKITPEGVVTTFAGSAGFSGNTDSHGTSASFTSPKGLAFDSSGNLFVADGFNVRKITPDRFVTTFAGTGSAGSAEGTGTSASFNEPIDIAIDGSDNLYVSDYLNNKIRKITPTGIVGTFVGTGSQGSADGPGTSATFYFPFGLTFDNSGNLYVADWANEKIRKVTPGRVVSTFAGSGTTGSQDGIGTSASFNYPDGIAFNIDNAIYVGDDANHLLRRVSLGSVKLTGTPTSMLVGDHNVTLKVADGNSGTAEQSFILTVVKSNTAPVVDLNGATAGLTTAHNYNENSEIKFATAGTVSDSDNDNITSMTVTITNSTQSNDDHYVAMDFQATAEKTAATNAGVTIGFMSNGVMNITGSASAQIYQDILQNLIYGNSSDVPPSETFNIEVVVNDGTVNSATASSAITIIPLNDGSSAFGTGNDPTFTEGGNAVTLFSNMTGHTQEANETITGFKFTVTNVTSNSGADEKLTVDGTAIALNNGNSGTTSGNNLSYSVSISGSTATVSLSGGTFTASAFATLLEGVKYENINQNPSNASREVTLSEVTDSGAQGAGHDNPWATNHAVSTVSVSPVNDPSVFTSATTANFAENGTGTAYTITATDVESSNFTYALGTGNDEDKFNINGNLVTFKTAPDFENPTDGGTNNTYVIEVKVTENSLTVNQNVTITVTDVVEDVTSPVLSTPTVSNLQDLYFTLNLDLDESGTAYYVVVADGANAPTSAEVKAGTASGGGSAIISGNKAFNESPEFSGIAQIAVLTPVTSYDVYVVAEDVNANLQAIPTKVDVTTAVLSPNFRWTTATRPSNGTVAETVNGVTATVTTSGTDADFADASNGLGTIFNLVGATGVNASMTVTFDSPVNLTSIQLLYLAPSANWLLTPAGGSNAVVNSGELSPGGNVVNVNWIGVTSFTLTLEGGGTTNFGMDEIVVNPNSAPVVDLDGATSGFINENGSIGIADYATVTDADNDNIVSMTISVTGYTGTNADQYLGINGAINTIATNAGVTVGAYDTNTGIMAITGSATAATYQSILQGIVYGNNSDTPPAGDVVIHIEVNDGTVKSSDVTNTITITPVNDEPVFTSQVVTSVNEGEPYTYNFAATDVDGDALTFTTPTTPSWLSLVNAPGGIGSAVSTFAGNGTAGNQNGTGTNAILDTPVSFTIDANGNLYALTKSGEIKKITAQGVVSTYLSQVISGITDASSSQMDIDSNGNIYYTVGDATVMKVTPQGVSSTFIADPRSGKNPELAIISGGNYFVIDNNDVMYFRSFSGFLKIDLNTNQVTEVFANGPSMPERVGEDNQGNIILTVVDLAGVANTTIQKLNGDNSLTLLLDLGAPTIIDDLVFDASGNMIFVDKAAHLVKTYNATDGIVTLAGGAGQSLIDGTGTSAGFNKPISIEIDNSQNLYVLDVLNHAIRKIEANAGQQSLSGTAPSTAGTHNVVLKADDNNGGTAEQSFTITVNDVTDPVFTSATAVNFAEDGTGTAYTVVATDANQVTYSLGTGNDEGLFNINGGIVTFKNAPDFEAPADGDTNNTYVINVIASDGTHSVNQDVTITVTDVNENVAPVFTSQPVTSLEFGETYNYEFTATDGNGDALTFTAPTLPTALSLTSSAGNVVSTVAGASTGGSTDGTASSATFNEPQDVAIDSQGNLYVSDLENYRIRKITPAGVVTTLAGGGKGQSDGTGTAAAFRAVKGIVVDSNDNIFVADTDSHTIRKITQGGVVTSFAGTIGSGGTTDGTGTNARFNIPYGLTIDSNDNLYVTDAQNSGIVRKITPAGVVTTLPSIGFNQGIGIIGIAADVAGDVYLSNHISQKIVKLDVSAGTTSDFASLGFNPYDLAFDKDGNLFISDATNAIYVRSSSGTVSLLAGGTTGSTDGAGAAAAFNAPLGLTTDATGNLFIAERDAHNIRMIAAGGQRISGTVNSLGDFNVVLRADDSNGGVTEQAFTITVSDNTDPSFTSVTTASFAENGTGTAYTIAATDASALTYSLGTGNDEGLFNIANGLVTFKAAPDFENPTDGNTDNDYVINMIATDAVNNSSNQNVTITVTDVQENVAPVFTSQPVTSLEFGETYNYEFTASDANGDALTFTAPTLPSALSITSSVGNVVSTVAGASTGGSTDGTASSATFNEPQDVAIDSQGNLYVSDLENYRIRKITPAGVVTTLAGGGKGQSDGTGTAAAFRAVKGIVVDSNDNIFVADTDSHTIRKVTQAGVVTSFAGTIGSGGTTDGTGTNARFNIPYGLTIDSNDNLYVTDAQNSGIVRKITPAGVVTTLPSIGFNQGIGIIGIAADAAGDVYLSNHISQKIVKLDVSAGTTSDFASLGFNPYDLAFDKDGNLFISDATNAIYVRNSSGTVSLLAGGTTGSTDGAGTAAAFNAPLGLTTDATGNLFIAERNAHNIRKIAAGGQSLSGTINSLGDFNVVLRADDSNGGITEQAFTITVSDNTDPSFTSVTTASFAENGTGTAYTVTATDANQVTYSLGTGNDEALFNINGGVVTFKVAPDFETPGGSNTDNTYVINVVATDAANNAVNQDVTITVTDVDEIAPIISQDIRPDLNPNANQVDITFNENVFGGTGSGPVEASDFSLLLSNNTVVNTPVITSITNNAGQVLVGGETVLRVNFGYTGTSTGDETLTFTPVQGAIFDAAGNAASTQQTYGALELHDNTFPTITGITLGEASGTHNNNLTYYIDVDFSEAVNGVTFEDFALSFSSSQTGLTHTVTTIAGTALTGVETTVRLNLTFNTGEAEGNTINVMVANNTIFDRANNPVGATDLTTTLKVDQVIPGIGFMQLDANNSVLTTFFTEKVFGDGNASLPLQTDDLSISVSGGTATGATITSLTNGGGGALVGGEEQVLVNFTLTGTPNGDESVTLDAATVTSIFDEAGYNQDTPQGDNVNKVSLNDIYAPAFTSLTTETFAENGTGTAYTVAATDANAVTYSLGTGNDEGLFNIANGLVTFKSAPDFENPGGNNTDNTYVINVIATDASNNAANQNVTITVTDVDDTAPVFTSLTTASFAENGTGTAYTVAATDANAVTYSLGTGNDEGLFDITNDLITFKAAPDFENPGGNNTDNTYVINVIATDASNNAANQNVTITVTDVDDTAPVFTSLTTASFAENGTGTAYTISATDANAVTYSLGTGNDEDLFNIANGLVTFKSAPDFENPGGNNTDNTYVINVIATDASNNAVNQNVTITVTNVNDNDPVFTSQPIIAVNGGEEYVYQYKATDGDGDDLTFSAPTIPTWLSLEASGSGGQVTTFVGNGTAADTDGTGTSASFDQPEAMAVDSNDNLYVYTFEKISKVSPAGVKTDFASVERNVTKIDFDSNDNLYVFTSSKIYKIDQSGNITFYAAPQFPGQPAAEVSFGRDMIQNFAMDAGNGILYIISSGSIKSVDLSDGSIGTTSFNTNGMNVEDMIIDSQGNLIFTYIEATFYNVGRSTPQGSFTQLFNTNSTNKVSDVVVDANGDIIFIDQTAHLIKKHNATDGITTLAGGAGQSLIDGEGTAAGFNQPDEIVLDSNGNAFVSDALNHAVRKLSLGGGRGLNGTAPLAQGDHNVVLRADDGNGGVTDQSFTITVNDITDPLFTSGTAETFAENGTGAAHTVAATDANAVTYALGTGNDEALFDISAGVVTFKNAPDFEAPGDGDTNNDYMIEVQANDGTNTAKQTVTITVTDVDDTAPVFTSLTTASFAENGTGTAYTVAATDANSITYSLGTGNDEALFDINGGVVTFKAAPDFEQPGGNNTDNTYVINVIATDGANNAANQNVTITVTDVDDTAPVFTSLTTASFAENGTGTAYTVAATDANAVTYSFGSGNDEGLFDINGGVVTFKNAPDFEAPGGNNTNNTYVINVIATDAVNNAANQNVTITVTDVDEIAPSVVLTASTNAPVGGAYEITAQFSEDVTGFELADITVTGGTPGSFATVDANTYTFFVTSGGGGADVSVAASLAHDLAGNANVGSNILSLVFTVTPPAKPIITHISDDTGASNTDGITSDRNLTVSGTSDPNAVINLFANGQNVNSSTADANGNWTVDASHVTLPAITFSFLATASDGAGNTSENSDAFSVSIDFTAPAKPVITHISDDTGSSSTDGVTSDRNLTVSGTSEPNALINLFANGQNVNSAQADANGNWTVDASHVTLPAITFGFVASASDVAGNMSGDSDPFSVSIDFTAPAKPVITHISDDTGSSSNDGITSDRNILINGTAEAGVSVDVFSQGGKIGTVQADANGDWMLDISGFNLPEFTQNMTAEAIDLAGNRSAVSDIFTITIDITAPAKPVITHISDDTGSSSTDGVTSDRNLTVSGTSEPNALINLFANGQNVNSAQADGNGNWTVDASHVTLPAITFGFVARASDVAGNMSGDSDPFSVSIDFTAPAKPVITHISDDTGSSSTDGVTSDRNILINGTAEAGVSVDVFSQAGKIGTVEADANGDWMLDISGFNLPEFTQNMTAEAIDLAGNRSAVSDIFTITIDFTAPVKPIITHISDDTGSSSTDGITSDRNLMVSGTSEPNALINFYAGGTNVTSALANGNGDWTIDVSHLTLPTITFGMTVTATDVAGNVSDVSDPYIATIDFTGPTVALSAPSGPTEGSFVVTAQFNEDVTGLALGDITVATGTASNLVTVDARTYTFSVSSGNNAADVTIAASLVADIAGNANIGSNQVNLDFTAPAPVGVLENSLADFIKSEEISIYPNPAKDILNIDLSEISAEKVDITLINASGLAVFERAGYTEKAMRLDVSTYNSGLYIVQFYDGSTVIRKKVMIRK